MKQPRCIDEADRSGEGAYQRTELALLSDSDLANTVLQAWWDYARSNIMD